MRAGAGGLHGSGFPATGTGDLPLLEAAFVQAPIGMGVVDAEGRYLRVNRALCQLLGRTEEDLLTRTYHEIFHPDDLDREGLDLARLLSGAVAAYEGENRRVRPDGTVVWVRELVSAAPDGRGRSLYILRQLVDVTAQRELTLALEDARREAVAASRQALEANRAKTEFLARVSHELRTPLSAMLGFAELLQGEDLPERQAGQMAHVVSAGRHLVGLVDELLDLARIEQGRLELSLRPLALDPVLAEVDALVRRASAGAGLVHPPPADGSGFAVLADHGRLVEILLNLLSNAVKFSAAGDTIGLSARSEGGRVSITVTDTGPGLTPGEQRRLFVPFERLGAEQRGIRGSGLGLAVSRRLAEAMGGELTLVSEPGHGCAFTVSLPAAEITDVIEGPVPVTPPWSDERHAILRSRRWSILYVEDDPVNARLVDAVLSRFCEVDLVVEPTGREGLERLATGAFDLVLLDLSLPDMSGAEVLERLRAEPATAGLPVVVLTADASATRRGELLRAGAQAFQGKPITVRSLLDTLADLLRGAPAGPL